MDVLSPFIPVLCHSDWLFHGEFCPRLDVVHPRRAWSSSPACTWHCSLHYLFLQATPLYTYWCSGMMIKMRLQRWRWRWWLLRWKAPTDEGSHSALRSRWRSGRLKRASAEAPALRHLMSRVQALWLMLQLLLLLSDGTASHQYRVGQKSKLLILSEYANKTEKIGGMWKNKNSYRENEALFDFRVVTVYILNCLGLFRVLERPLKCRYCKNCCEIFCWNYL